MAPEADSVVRVCSKSEVTPGSVKAFAVGDKTLAVYNIDGTFYATDDECTHAAASLADGMIEGDVIECCMHMGSFHIPTGKVMQPPCEVPLRTYQVGTHLNGNPGATQVIAYVVSGVGFLGAGVILKQGNSVSGLNTAAPLVLGSSRGLRRS